MAIIVFIIILGVLILVHEAGHFIAAKKNGVLVEEFGLGYPPRIFAIKIGETVYSLNLLPFGGFTKVYGEERDQINKKTNKKLLERAFVNKNPFQKTIILLAGVIGNFLLGWVLISYLFTQGVPVPVNKVIVENVAQKSPAAIAGIRKNDTIISIVENSQEKKITSPNEIINFTKKYAGTEVGLIVKRGKERIKLKLVPRKNPPKNQGSIGISISTFQEKKYPWYKAPFYGLKNAFQITLKITQGLTVSIWQLITFNKDKTNLQVTGPIGIAVYTNKIIKFGRNALLEFVAILSLNLAVINLIPFPALDGGRIAFLIYESITKKQINKKLESRINSLGFLFLILLLVIVSVVDVRRLFLK